MAMSPSEAEASTQNKKTTMIQRSMQERLATAEATIIELIAPFLNDAELGQFCSTAHFARDASYVHDDMAARKKVKEELLPYVFNADPRAVEAFFIKPRAKPEMVLTKTSFREGYQSKKNQRFVCLRSWQGVSSLQAAALSLDNFLVVKLLGYIVRDNNLRLEAMRQLKEVKKRPPKTCTTDFAEYAAPVKDLEKAYSDYLTQHSSLSLQKKWEDLDKLWDIIGDYHRKLPRYVLQEFFKGTAWSDDPDFSLEPPRGPLHFRYWSNGALNVDGLGEESFCALFKGNTAGCDLGRDGLRRDMWDAAHVDSAVLSRLSALRQAGLENIIDQLQTLETALALVTIDKGVDMRKRQKC